MNFIFTNINHEELRDRKQQDLEKMERIYTLMIKEYQKRIRRLVIKKHDL